MMKRKLQRIAVIAFIAATFSYAPAQTAPAASPQSPAAAEREAAGSQPDDPGPLATGLSEEIRRRDVLAAMKKVADWQLTAAEGHYNIQWTYAALYDGLLAASRATGDQRYHDRVQDIARQNHWELGPRFGHADDDAIGLAYLTLYAEAHEPEMLAPTRANLDKLMARPEDADTSRLAAADNILWWWCDAFYMAPPVFAQLAQATGDRRYLDFMDRQWSLTTAALYDKDEHLYFRDKRFPAMREANGQKIFWSRGNGWVLAALALVLERMPASDPFRAKYVDLYRTMAKRIAGLQPADGVWRASLLDPNAYPNPEVSGTGFFTFAMAWGINRHLLDRRKYLPVVSKAWRGMIAHVYEDGRLGSIQPIGGEPGKYKPSSSYVYGVGAFLLAGSEVSKLSGK
jgi:unsaturated rhamnogalacturonyl hydrolase